MSFFKVPRYTTQPVVILPGGGVRGLFQQRISTPLTRGTGEVARPLPLPPQSISPAPLVFRGGLFRRMAAFLPRAGGVPGRRGGLFAGHGKFILAYRQILQRKLDQGIPLYMAQKYATDEARKEAGI